MTDSLPGPQLLDSYSTEKHYSVAELAKLWSLSERTIRRMFENEPGVLAWGRSETRFKRGYRTLRIPETVVLRVHRQLRNAS
jgi:transcriptional regulator GlxA family with amidase domain